METTTQQQSVNHHIAILPAPGMGHLIPLAEFARQLILNHHFSATFILLTDSSPTTKAQKAILESLPKSKANVIFLPPVSLENLPKDVKIETRITLSMTRSLPCFRDVLKVLTESTRVSALVVDVFGTEAFSVAQEFGVPSYLLYTSTAMTLSYCLYLPILHESCTCEYSDLPALIKIPGCLPVHGNDLPDAIQDKKNESYELAVNHCAQLHLADGILVNSFLDLEPDAFKALKEGECLEKAPPVFPIGPLVKTIGSASGDDHNVLRWLDGQPRGSVLFVCFGSGGTLSHEQLNELALGLEMSRQRFLWVVKTPNDRASNACYLNLTSPENPFDFLPEGFLDRTRGVGLVVPWWAPQVQVLSHGSTGGFLTHCGWNSILESIVNGVPLICWPLYAEQRMNAVLLTEGLKVGFRVKMNENGIAEREGIAKYASGLIQGDEGKKLRDRMRKLKDSAAVAISQDGSSSKVLALVAQTWKNSARNEQK